MHEHHRMAAYLNGAHPLSSVCLLYPVILTCLFRPFGSVLNMYVFSDHKSTVQMFEFSPRKMGENTKSVTLMFFAQ